MRVFTKACLILFIWGVFMGNSSAQQSDMLESDSAFENMYLLNLSGTVYKERFSNAQALLTISESADHDPNPFLVIIQGFPKRNSRNALFWYSENTPMESLSDGITCVIKRSVARPLEIHFFYVSPYLFEDEYGEPLVNVNEEILRMREAQVLPTRVWARAGKLSLKIHADTVSGTVWLKGYDSVEKAFVLYSAMISGRKATKLKPKFQLKEK